MKGTHHELHFRSAGLKRKRDQMKADARQTLAKKEELVHNLMEYEREQIESGFNAAVDKVREKMDMELLAQVRVLEQRRDGKEGEESRMSTRSLRSKKNGRTDDDEDDDDEGPEKSEGQAGGLAGIAAAAVSKETTDAANKRRTKRALSPASMHLDKSLDEDEIKDDKYQIERDAEMERRREMMAYSNSSSSSGGGGGGGGGGRGASGSSSNRKKSASSSSTSSSAASASSTGNGSKKSGGQASSGRSTSSGDGPSVAPTSSGERFVQVNIKQGQLQFEQALFLKNDPVVVIDSKNTSNPKIGGIISSINNSEVSRTRSLPNTFWTITWTLPC